MADNRIFEHGRKLSVTASHPTTPASGKPLRVGNLVGVALVDEDSAGLTSADFGPAVYSLSVKGVDDDGNVAVAAGDVLYYVDADVGTGTGFLSKKDSGRVAGIALAAVTSGSTATIQVLIGSAGVGGVGQVQLPAGFLKVGLVSGGAAGDHTLTGIAVGDEIVFVGHFSTEAAIATLGDLTSEFSVTAADTINNTGGTATTNDQLMVIYIDRT